MSSGVQVCDLSVDLGEFHLREITLDVAPGEYMVVLGPTGGGKTVLLETIAGLHRPRRGQVRMNGEDATATAPEERGIGFVYQDYALFPHLNVADNIAFGLTLGRGRRHRGKRRLPSGTAIEQRVNEMAQLLSIEHLLHRNPSRLSGGEQQRVALARALIVKPRLLLLDEPLSALDPTTREDLQRELARLHRALGTTTIHVTHNFEEAVALGDRIAVLNSGHIVQVGLPDEIFRKPASEFVARFVGVRNILQGDLQPAEGGYKLLALDGIQIAVVTELTGRVRASIRPEDIFIFQELRRSSVRNTFRGRIVEIADRGTLLYVTVHLPPDLTCVITRRSLEELELTVGQEVSIGFKASAVHVF
ncbi:MAG: ABC transporter ATP-binding protein [Anaerolineae bacterium]|nr:ABC transporter ATP-binding protein [Anaerolineae bacterium]